MTPAGASIISSYGNGNIFSVCNDSASLNLSELIVNCYEILPLIMAEVGYFRENQGLSVYSTQPQFYQQQELDENELSNTITLVR
jgi:hypothetical protein